MKNCLRYIPLLIAVLFVLRTETLQAQLPCTVSFSFTTGPNGSVTFTAAATPTTALYTWSFGNSQPPLTQTSNTAATTYTANGVYTVSLTIMSTSGPSCTATFSQNITITNACSLTIAYTPPSPPNACNGTATVTAASGMCGIPSYTWGNGTNSAVTGGLCQGQTYSVFASASGTLVSCCSFVTGTVTIPICSLQALFATTSNQSGPVSFSSTSTGTIPGSTYNWQFGDGGNATGAVTSHTYLANGTYIATLTVVNSINCLDSITMPVSIINSTCNVLASFNYSFGATPGSLFFSSPSAPTGSTTIYTWNFGDGSAPISAPGQFTTTHTYTAAGTYSATLQLSTTVAPFCTSISMQTVVISVVPCSLNAAIGYSISPGGLGTFFSTSTGTMANTTYTWNIGGTITSPATLSTVYHQFSSGGNVAVILTAMNNDTSCVDSAVIFINVPCITPTAALAHTVGLNGQVSFGSTSLGTYTGTTYLWEFGDGVYTGGSSPQHTYINAGVYMVQLKVKNDTLCRDSVTQAVNVTGIGCYANPNFTLTPTPTPQYWNATPAYPWNVTAASWDWGDGSVSNTLYASHIYSAAAAYNICLSVTVSCGSTGSVCTSYGIYRTQEQSQDMSLIYVNVQKPGLVTGINTAEAEPVQFIIYPNPSNGAFSIRAAGVPEGPVRISLHNLVGQMVYARDVQAGGGMLEQDLQINDLVEGIYMVKLQYGNSTVLKKIIIAKP